MTRTATCLLIAILAACGGGGGDDGPPPTGPITANVTHYDYRFDVDSRAASVTVTATVTVGGDCLDLPYRAGELQTAATMINGVLARTVTVDAGAAHICGTGYFAGETLTIDTAMAINEDTLGATDVGYSHHLDRFGNDQYYLVSWVEGCDQFGPCDNRPEHFATYKFTVTHPAGLTVRCPGTIAEPDATTTTCDFGFTGGPSYSTFGVIGVTGYTTTQHTFGDLAVEFYDHAGTGIEARIDDAYHGGFITFMESHFGPFPFGTQLRILTADTYWGGFEHPGNIVMSDTLGPLPPPTGVHYKDPLQHTLDHEMTHQWAGDQTTIATTYDFVWKESMAEYLAYAYEELTDPGAAAATRAYWKADSNVANGYYPVPEDDPKPALVDYYGYVYGPGPMILFKQIEMLSSRDAVLTALSSVLGSERALSVGEVEDALEAATGLDLSAYFAAWVHGAGHPVWPRISATYDGASGVLSVQQTNTATAGEKPCKFKVELRGATIDERQKVEVDTLAGGPTQDIQVTPAPTFTVVSTAIDPDNECLVFTATAAPPSGKPHANIAKFAN